MALSKKLKKTISGSLSELKKPVRILLFTSGRYPKVEKEIEMAMNEIVSLNGKLSLEKYKVDSRKAKSEGITNGPVIMIDGEQKGKIRFFGFPSGYQFPIFIMDVLEASGARQKINPKVAKQAKAIKKKTRIQVFEMPACTYSPIAVKVAHDIAIINENVTADMVDAFLFPELIKKYGIRETPATVINGKLAFTGVRTLHQLVKKIV